MVIKTTLSKEQRLQKLQQLSQKVINSGVMNNPKFKDPKGITVFCGNKYQQQPQPLESAR